MSKMTMSQGPEPDVAELRWNTRYEASKPRLIQRLKALMRYSDESELDRAEQTIAAIRSLPNVGEYGGSVRIENRVARQPGDSDFIYSLFASDQGFELSYHERLTMEGGQWDYTDTMTLVKCNPVGWDSDDESLDEDEEALENMREFVEMMAGRPSATKNGGCRSRRHAKWRKPICRTASTVGSRCCP